MLDLTLLNWLKDVGVATVTLLVMFKLVQASIEFLRGIREDNQERNRQFELLLNINKSIADQMELTRQAIEHSTHSSEQQDSAIRTNTEGLDALRLDIVLRLDALAKQITGARQDILHRLERAVPDEPAPLTQPERD
jgi:hypothetical protein